MTRAERAAVLEAWADAVDPADLRSADTAALRLIADLVQQRNHVDAELRQSVQAARAAQWSWSEIGTMLGVSKQAAQRKYGTKTPGLGEVVADWEAEHGPFTAAERRRARRELGLTGPS